jgi:hypothetical protein
MWWSVNTAWWTAEGVAGMWHFKQLLDGFTGHVVRRAPSTSTARRVVRDILAGTVAWHDRHCAS